MKKKQKPVIALLYDFDKTLCTINNQGICDTGNYAILRSDPR